MSVHDITTYGAINNADSTAAINAAIAACAAGDTLLIPAGNFFVAPQSVPNSQSKVYVALKSGVTLQVDGSLHALPTNSAGYAVVSVSNCVDTHIVGSGNIIGDRLQHTGVGGEWGHGIDIENSQTVSIQNVKVSQTWGDGIMINGNANTPPTTKDVNINGVGISNARRNGVSIISANGVNVTHSDIGFIGGTAPGQGIDCECDLDSQTVENVNIQYNNFHDCAGANINVGSPGSYHGFTINNNSYDFKSQPITVVGGGGDLGTPWWAVLLRPFFGWKFYPTSWSKN